MGLLVSSPLESVQKDLLTFTSSLSFDEDARFDFRYHRPYQHLGQYAFESAYFVSLVIISYI